MENSSVILAIFLVILLFIIFRNSWKTKKCGANASARAARSAPRKATFGGGGIPMSDDYNEYILNTGLEKSVIDSHRKFAAEIDQRTSGPSAQTTFSHDEDPSGNGWRGLRRPNFDVYIDPNAREVPSSYQGQMPKNKKYDKCGLF